MKILLIIKQIKNKPDISIDNIIKMQLSNTFTDASNKDEELFEFTAAQEDDEEEEIKNENIAAKFTIDVEEEIDIDDI